MASGTPTEARMTSGSGDISGRTRLSEASGKTGLAWRRLVFAIGPGLVAMLADTDAGSVITVAQSGARWGYRLLLPNLLLIPLMFMAQELALRLGLGTRRGAVALVSQRFGRGWAALLVALLTLSCAGALVSQLSGLAGAGTALGVPVWATMIVTVGGLCLVVSTGSYKAVQRLALVVGLFELAFLAMAWRAAPGLAPILRQAVVLPLRDHDYLYLLAANIGTSIIPWTLVYQQSAGIDKGLGPGDLGAARLETGAGVVLCQTITSALLIAAGALLDRGGSLATVAEIETAFTATLGPTAGHVIFVVGLSGSALVAMIVICLALSWSLGEIFAGDGASERLQGSAVWFRGALCAMLAGGGAVVASGVDLVRLSVAAGVLNALLLPVVMAFLYRLVRTVLPPPLRPGRVYSALVAAALLLVSAIGVYAGLGGLW
jgi:Mn2+/Fe2+ NRAMP family transporter